MGFTDTSDSSSGFLSGSDFENLPLHPESLKSAELNESLGLSHSQHLDTEIDNKINTALSEINPADEDLILDNFVHEFQNVDSCDNHLRAASNEFAPVTIHCIDEKLEIHCDSLGESTIIPSSTTTHSENIVCPNSV